MDSAVSFEKLVAYFAEKPKTTRNVVYYNLTWVSLLDDFYSVEVHELLDQMQQEFMITAKKKAEVIKLIGADAFYGLKKLTSVNIPSSVKTVENRAFGGCTKLLTITVEKSEAATSSWGSWNPDNCTVVYK